MKKFTFIEVLENPEGRQMIEGIEGLDHTYPDHRVLYRDYQKRLLEKFGYDYQSDLWD